MYPCIINNYNVTFSACAARLEVASTRRSSHNDRSLHSISHLTTSANPFNNVLQTEPCYHQELPFIDNNTKSPTIHRQQHQVSQRQHLVNHRPQENV
ncbi:unnamed protein product [Caenorhabditis angaria]|uniref:Uncharacterized protein n=1 Tax=Caenorhabditis angaria TaxID=860376 RepID=A0A9P1I4R2_9PELO|nr:unnamed protein product [Caenorhabditis angaria]